MNRLMLSGPKPQYLPTVMTKEETIKVITAVPADHQLIIKLIYGSGLRRRNGQSWYPHFVSLVLLSYYNYLTETRIPESR